MASTQEVTLGMLVEAIRGGASLRDLKHMVGPSREQIEESKKRIQQLNAISNSMADRPGMGAWPHVVRERYDQINQEQALFESEYCSLSLPKGHP